jgi:prepilin-type N-terminal cleavage/methylation domain-containing protein
MTVTTLRCLQTENKCTRRRSACGFTLVEVICAIAIGAISASVLFVGFDMGYGILGNTRDDLRATQILLQKTEAIRLFTWTQLSQATNSFQEYYYPSGTNSGIQGTLFYGTFNATGYPTDIIPASTGYVTNIHLVTITVNWTNGVHAHSRTMQTLNAAQGMQNYLYGKDR